MSAETPYEINIYSNFSTKKTHKVFKVSPRNDIPRQEHRNAAEEIEQLTGKALLHVNFLLGSDDVAIDHQILASDKSLSLIQHDLDALLTQSISNWSDFQNEIQEKLAIDYDNEKIVTGFIRKDPREIDFGYTENELILIDILVFIKYGLNYLQENPQAGMTIEIEETL